MIQERGERKQELQEKESNEDMKEAEADSSLAGRAGMPGLCVLCLPAHGEGDELAGMMLAQVVDIAAVPWNRPGYGDGRGQPTGRLRRTAPSRCGLHIRRAASSRGAPRRLHMRLRRRFPELNLVVGLWNSPGT